MLVLAPNSSKMTSFAVVSRRCLNTHVVNIQSRVPFNEIPPHLQKAIRTNEQKCEKSFRHLIKFHSINQQSKRMVQQDYRASVDDRDSLIYEPTPNYIPDKKIKLSKIYLYDRSLSRLNASEDDFDMNQNDLHAGHENPYQMYPILALRNLQNLFSLHARKLPSNKWDVSSKIQTRLGVPVRTPPFYFDSNQLAQQPLQQTLSNSSSKKSGKRARDKSDTDSKAAPKAAPTHTWETSELELNQSSAGGTAQMRDAFGPDMPFLKCGDHELLVFRDLAYFMKCESFVHNVLLQYKPTKIVMDANCGDISKFFKCKYESWTYHTTYYLDQIASNMFPLNSNLNLKLGYRLRNVWKWYILNSVDHAPSYAMRQIMQFTANNALRGDCINLSQDTSLELVATNWNNNYYDSLTSYSLLLDLFTLAVLENSELMKKNKSWKMINYNQNHKLNDRILYCLAPYLMPHKCLFDTIRNDWTLYAINGILNASQGTQKGTQGKERKQSSQAKSRKTSGNINKKQSGTNRKEKILVVANANSVQDLIYKLTGKTMYNKSVFKEVKDGNVTMSSQLQVHPRYENFELSQDEWRVVAATFGKKMAEFLKYETDNRRNLFNLKHSEELIKMSDL